MCDSCAQSLPQCISSNRCDRCSIPLPANVSQCERCRRSEYWFEENLSLYAYRDSAMALVQAIKFGNRRHLIRFVAQSMAQMVPSSWREATIVPVPSRRAAVKRRGYDLTGLTGRFFSEALELPVENLLARRGGQQQKSLSFTERRKNVTGLYLWRDPERRAPENTIVVDDVFTTGATVSECARVLKEHGSIRVLSVTIAMEQ